MEITVEIPSEHEKIHFYCSNCQTPQQVAQKACGVSICRHIKNPTGDNPGQPAPADYALCSGWDEMISRGALQPQSSHDSVITCEIETPRFFIHQDSV